MQEKGELDFSFGFGILVAPFRSRSSKHDCWFDGSSPRIRNPSLVVMGETDRDELYENRSSRETDSQ